MSTSLGTSGPTPDARRRRLLVVTIAVLAAVVLGWLVLRGLGDSDGDAGAGSPTGPEPSSTASPTPSSTVDPSAAPRPTVTPDTPTTPAPGDPSVAPEQPALPEPLPPRALDEEVELGEQAVARVVRLEAVEGEPQGVGEIAGPALRFAVELENTGSEPLPLDNAVVNVTYGPDAVPATELSGPGREPFTGALAPGERASGVYVFLVPVDARDAIAVTLEYRFGAPIAVFQGSASAAPAG